MDKSQISYDLLMRSLDCWATPRLTDEGLVYRLAFPFLDSLTATDVLLTEMGIEAAIAIEVGHLEPYLKQLQEKEIANGTILAEYQEPWAGFAYSHFLRWLGDNSRYPLPRLKGESNNPNEVEPFTEDDK